MAKITFDPNSVKKLSDIQGLDGLVAPEDFRPLYKDAEVIASWVTGEIENDLKMLEKACRFHDTTNLYDDGYQSPEWYEEQLSMEYFANLWQNEWWAYGRSSHIDFKADCVKGFWALDEDGDGRFVHGFKNDANWWYVVQCAWEICLDAIENAKKEERELNSRCRSGAYDEDPGTAFSERS